MRIELRPDVRSPIPDAVCVGTLDGAPLAYVARAPFVGTAPVEPDTIAVALAEAVDVAAARVFGSEWSSDLARVTGLNRRTVTRDRIEKYGLPAFVLTLIGRAAAHRHPRALGFHMLGISALALSEDREGARGEPAEIKSRENLEAAIEMFRFARAERGKAPSSKFVEKSSGSD